MKKIGCLCTRDVFPKLQANVLSDQTGIKQNIHDAKMELGVCVCVCLCVKQYKP